MKTSPTPLVVAVLGLLHLVQLMPINGVPAKVEETFLREVMTDGFIVDNPFSTTASRGLVVDESDMTEASGSEEGSGDSTTFRLPWSSSRPSQAAPPNATTTSLFSEEDGSGSGFGSGSGLRPGSASTTSVTTVSKETPGLVPVRDLDNTNQGSTKMIRVFMPEVGSLPENTDKTSPSTALTTAPPAIANAAQEIEFKEPPTPSKQGAKAGSSGWMVIVGFVVGIAALVLVCIAVATKDSWNGPRKAVIEAERKGSNAEKHAEEMKEFLPKEEGHKEDYTMVPLTELSDKTPLS